MLPATINCVVELSSSKLKPEAVTEVLISLIAPTILPFSVVPNEAKSPISVDDKLLKVVRNCSSVFDVVTVLAALLLL